jgi:hypothetical protein
VHSKPEMAKPEVAKPEYPVKKSPPKPDEALSEFSHNVNPFFESLVTLLLNFFSFVTNRGANKLELLSTTGFSSLV